MTRLDDHELARIASSAYEPPTRERVDAVRSNLLAAAEDSPQRPPQARWPSWLTSAAAVVLACIAVAVWWSKNTPHPAEVLTLATVTTSGAATFERASLDGAESVHLHDGAIHLDVVELGPSQSFAVITPDARIVVRGTSFTTVVRERMLRRVEVVSGRVEIHRDGEPVLTLRGGETWSREESSGPVAVIEPSARRAEAKDQPPEQQIEVAATPEPRAVRRPKPPARPLVAPKAETARPTEAVTRTLEAKNEAKNEATNQAKNEAKNEPKAGAAPTIDAPTTEPSPKPEPPALVHPAELAFQEGWRAMRAEQFEAAAAAFLRADVEASPVRAEAQYLYAVALMRAGDPAARLAFESFIETHPSAARADEAALLLGRLHVMANDHGAARPWLERAARSSRRAVRVRAEKLLASPSAGSD